MLTVAQKRDSNGVARFGGENLGSGMSQAQERSVLNHGRLEGSLVS